MGIFSPYSVVILPRFLALFFILPGDVRLTSLLDYESTSEYELQIEATDGVTTSVASVNISVTDVNETPYFDNLPASANNIPENEKTAILVFTTTAMDVDAGDAVTYTIVETHPAFAPFVIDATTGRTGYMPQLIKKYLLKFTCALY